MSTPSIQISEHVAGMLNNVDGWHAERRNYPMLQKSEVPNEGFIMQVIPNGYALLEDNQSRGVFVEQYSVAVTCYRKANVLAEQDEALEDIDRVRRYLLSTSLTEVIITGDAGTGNAMLRNTMLNNPEMDMDRLKDEHVFQSVIQLDYVLYRERAQ